MSDVTLDLEFVRRNTIDTIKGTRIRKSTVHGFGLFTVRCYKKGEILCILDGQILSIDKYNSLQKNISNHIENYKDYFFMECNYLDIHTCLTRAYRTKYSYINHSKKPNVYLAPYPLRLIVLDDLEADQELLLDYTKEKLSDAYMSKKDKEYLNE